MHADGAGPRSARKQPHQTIYEIALLLSVIENFGDFLHRVPIARGSRHAEELLDLTEITDRLHLPTIHAQNESALDRNDLQQPVVIRGQTERNVEWLMFAAANPSAGGFEV